MGGGQLGRRGAGEQTETADARKPWGSLSSLVPGWRSPTMLSVFTTTNNKNGPVEKETEAEGGCSLLINYSHLLLQDIML